MIVQEKESFRKPISDKFSVEKCGLKPGVQISLSTDIANSSLKQPAKRRKIKSEKIICRDINSHRSKRDKFGEVQKGYKLTNENSVVQVSTTKKKRNRISTCIANSNFFMEVQMKKDQKGSTPVKTLHGKYRRSVKELADLNGYGKQKFESPLNKKQRLPNKGPIESSFIGIHKENMFEEVIDKD